MQGEKTVDEDRSAVVASCCSTGLSLIGGGVAFTRSCSFLVRLEGETSQGEKFTTSEIIKFSVSKRGTGTAWNATRRKARDAGRSCLEAWWDMRDLPRFPTACKGIEVAISEDTLQEFFVNRVT